MAAPPPPTAMILDTVSAQQSTVDLFTAPLSVLRTVMEISYFPAISMGLVNLGSEGVVSDRLVAVSAPDLPR
jgi:hypothetical protein